MAAILVSSSPQRPSERPHLRVIDGGRSPKRLAVTYRRRRLVVLVAALVLGLGALVTGRVVVAAVTPSSPARPPTGATADGAGSAAGPVVVVRPGDTLWSIARRASPGGDVRAAVDRLAAAHGPGPLEVGEVVPIGAAIGG